MKRTVFIGQAPARPGSKHDVAGSYIRPWLYRIGLDEETIVKQFRFYALVGDFPGSGQHGHLRPTPEQILEHRPVLEQLVKDFQPDIIVPVGAMAISEVLPSAKGKLGDIIGNSYTINPFNSMGSDIVAIPLPHPSGRSTWLAANPDKVDQALSLLKRELGILG